MASIESGKPSESDEDLIRYLRLVQQPGRLELVVLRAHLLAEELLHELIKKQLAAPEHFDTRNISFRNCLSLAKGMYWKEQNQWIWECLTLLNAARNHMAHSVVKRNDENVANKLDRIDELIGMHSGVPMPRQLEPSVDRMHWRLASLYSCMSKLNHA